ncbi:hypothetical protein [Shewanella salipaludis]|uniref:Zinc-regulated TonB-dependent outer membrane receptor n=1 Tax=Shewanella salipaludis TaxID=2723052 RepID=A0A972FVI4_9GAMM|nr:hypothetical protein [Shewanella salipaludis]NMH66858.1 hypothetical protein [Shewanella salipaludis]
MKIQHPISNPGAALLALGCTLASANALALDPTLTNPAISAVVDGYYQSSDRPMSERTEGFGLGETELALSANIDDMFYGKVTAVLESSDGESEINLEEAFIQTLAMPAGLSLRAGRFMSDIGYLNNQHLHTDAFTDRPVAYRALLGGHYFDDGVRLDYLAPTDIYWSLGAEAFKGDSMHAEDETGSREFSNLGVFTAYSKFGGDIGDAGSWMAGLSYLRNQNGRFMPHEEEAGAEEAGHGHSASYTGENTYAADFVYKWAPQGNYKYRHLTLSGEYFRVTGLLSDEAPAAGAKRRQDYHQAWYLSGVYQMSPNWSAGLRYGELDAQALEADEMQSQKLRETELSLGWHQSHFSTVRLQYTHQQGANFDGITDDNILTLQYVMSLGAHGAHQF